MTQVTQKDFYPVAYAGLLGGAAHAVTDSYLKDILPDDIIESLGLTVKDLAMIYLGVHAKKNWAKEPWQKDAALGMSIIAVYKTLYPRFLEPTIAGFLKKEG